MLSSLLGCELKATRAPASAMFNKLYGLNLARYSCAPASYRIGRDGACTRLLLDGQEERDENV